MTRILMIFSLSAVACEPTKGGTEDSGDVSSAGETGETMPVWPGGDFVVTVMTDPKDELAEAYLEYMYLATYMEVYYYEAEPDGCEAAEAFPVASLAAGGNWGGVFTVPIGWVCAWAQFYWVEGVPDEPDEIATQCYGETFPQYVDGGEEVRETITLACKQIDIGQPD